MSAVVATTRRPASLFHAGPNNITIKVRCCYFLLKRRVGDECASPRAVLATIPAKDSAARHDTAETHTSSYDED